MFNYALNRVGRYFINTKITDIRAYIFKENHSVVAIEIVEKFKAEVVGIGVKEQLGEGVAHFREDQMNHFVGRLFNVELTDSTSLLTLN